MLLIEEVFFEELLVLNEDLLSDAEVSFVSKLDSSTQTGSLTDSVTKTNKITSYTLLNTIVWKEHKNFDIFFDDFIAELEYRRADSILRFKHLHVF